MNDGQDTNDLKPLDPSAILPLPKTPEDKRIMNTGENLISDELMELIHKVYDRIALKSLERAEPRVRYTIEIIRFAEIALQFVHSLTPLQRCCVSERQQWFLDQIALKASDLLTEGRSLETFRPSSGY